MRILYVTPAYKPAWRFGGPVISVSGAAEALARQGHEVSVFTSNANLDEDLKVPLEQPVNIEGVEVTYFGRQRLAWSKFSWVTYFSKAVGFTYCPRLADALRSKLPQVDVVHTQLPFTYPTYAASRAALLARRPLFYHQRGVLDPERLKFRSWKKLLYLRLLEMPTLRRATTLLALTEAERVSFERLAPTTPCRVIPNGINATEYRTTHEPGSLEPYGIGLDDQVVLFLGRLHPIKGVEILLEAFCDVAQDLPRARLVLAGPDEFGLQSKLRSRASEAGLGNRVLFTGMVSGALKANLLARADLFCLPSHAEGFSMAVLEALASSTAVLLSPGCHFPSVEVAGAGRVTARDARAIGDALIELLSNPYRLDEMGRRGRELVERHYSWTRIADQLLECYVEGLSRYQREGNKPFGRNGSKE